MYVYFSTAAQLSFQSSMHALKLLVACQHAVQCVIKYLTGILKLSPAVLAKTFSRPSVNKMLVHRMWSENKPRVFVVTASNIDIFHIRYRITVEYTDRTVRNVCSGLQTRHVFCGRFNAMQAMSNRHLPVRLRSHALPAVWTWHYDVRCRSHRLPGLHRQRSAQFIEGSN